jgi:hypothetical protein
MSRLKEDVVPQLVNTQQAPVFPITLCFIVVVTTLGLVFFSRRAILPP